MATTTPKTTPKPAARKVRGKAATKPGGKAASAKPATKPAAKRTARAATWHKIGRNVNGNDLRFYTVAIMTALGMFKAGATVDRKLFAGFYMSGSILQNHGRNGNLDVTAETVSLTAQGRDFFNARIEDGLCTKTEIAAAVRALKSGKGGDLPERLKSYAKALYPHPSNAS